MLWLDCPRCGRRPLEEFAFGGEVREVPDSITDPDAQISEGFKAGIMSGAVASQKFDTRQQDVDALVAFIEQQG